MTAPHLVEHFFRHEYGRLVATLVRRVGVHHLEAIEDATQSALLSALEHWRHSGPPEHPSAWVYRAAHNQLLGDLRTRLRRQRILNDLPPTEPRSDHDVPLSGELPDAVLRMLFVCCDPRLPEESRLVLALKTLCGFSVHEIAVRRFTTEANVYKRLGRARARLRQAPFDPDALDEEAVLERRPAVQQVLYLLFTEGHLSSHAELAIRRELCDEALRLATILATHPVGETPETFALVALMQLHRARLDARQDEAGGLLLLEEQERSHWDQEAIGAGLQWLARSASGGTFSRYHAEARIAAAHCLSPSFAETRWDEIAFCYALLERLAPSPLHRLNRALAVAEWKGPTHGLAVIEGFEPPTWLAGSYLWSAALADLHRRSGNLDRGQAHLTRALADAPNDAVRELLRRRSMP